MSRKKKTQEARLAMTPRQSLSPEKVEGVHKREVTQGRYNSLDLTISMIRVNGDYANTGTGPRRHLPSRSKTSADGSLEATKKLPIRSTKRFS